MMKNKESITQSAVPSLRMECDYIRQNESELIGNPVEWQVKWNCRFYLGDQPVFNSDYMTGIGHLEGYKPHQKMSVDMSRAIRRAIANKSSALPHPCGLPRVQISQPEIDSVVYCLLTDSDVLNHESFEDWAECFGYDSDSRTAEKMYQACLSTALKIRNSIGEEKLKELHEAFSDF